MNSPMFVIINITLILFLVIVLPVIVLFLDFNKIKYKGFSTIKLQRLLRPKRKKKKKED